MSPESRRLAGILLIVYPTVIFGGVSLLYLLTSPETGYAENELRQGFWRAGHAHAGVLLLLSLVVLRFVDEANLSKKLKIFARYATPTAAILIPAAFFLSVIPKNATEPNALIYLGYVGAIILATGSIVLGIGLLNKTRSQ
jgi:Ni,Fe-hydrogenase I cytochrome b subunit